MDVKSYITSVLDATKIGPSSAATLPSPGSDSVTDAKKGSKFMAHYGRFQSMAARLKPLLLQLETRADKSYEYVKTLFYIYCVFIKCFEKFIFNVIKFLFIF